ncbi:MAG: 50S ribosomal protein L6 [Candidatus Woesearchaeota archaeon]|nr:MAG: 50S ribosomal protein L6 [Candidatus Woesearchaeota archaeon]
MVELSIEIPEGIEVNIVNRTITVKGPKGELHRDFPKEYLSVVKKGNSVVISGKVNKAKPIIGTFRSHITNMIRGVQEEFTYKMRVCFSHFPTTVEVQGDKFIVKNFLGGSKNREINIPKNVSVTVSGKEIEIKSVDKELAGSFAGVIEQKTRSRKKDLRIFQDGCYVISKAGKEV